MNKLEQLHLDAIEKSHHGYGYSNDDKMQAASKSAQITENIAIEFAEWLADTATWRNGSKGSLWYSMREKREDMTTKQLIAEFLKQRQ